MNVFQNSSNLVITSGTFNCVGGDLHVNYHYQSETERDGQRRGPTEEWVYGEGHSRTWTSFTGAGVNHDTESIDELGGEGDTTTPQISLCFLSLSGDRRIMQFEPEITVGRVKELMWNAWPTDWQVERPPNPWCLRLLYSGRALQDYHKLKDLSFPIHTSASQSETQDPQPSAPIVHVLCVPSFLSRRSY
ncbi:hypothetical protein L218DRAFT_968228 [Marasmius fiardii PR-910]|nr:hypothetical protein L218DRAFT_968228 [Marasmius fiardii PR-910]